MGHSLTQEKKGNWKSCAELKCLLTQSVEQTSSYEENFHSKIVEMWQHTSCRRSRCHRFHRQMARSFSALKFMGFVPQPYTMPCDGKTGSNLQFSQRSQKETETKLEQTRDWTCTSQKSTHLPAQGSLSHHAQCVNAAYFGLHPRCSRIETDCLKQ